MNKKLLLTIGSATVISGSVSAITVPLVLEAREEKTTPEQQTIRRLGNILREFQQEAMTLTVPFKDITVSDNAFLYKAGNIGNSLVGKQNWLKRVHKEALDLNISLNTLYDEILELHSVSELDKIVAKHWLDARSLISLLIENDIAIGRGTDAHILISDKFRKAVVDFEKLLIKLEYSTGIIKEYAVGDGTTIYGVDIKEETLTAYRNAGSALPEVATQGVGTSDMLSWTWTSPLLDQGIVRIKSSNINELKHNSIRRLLNLEELSLSEAITIGPGAVEHAELTRLELPKVTSIAGFAFSQSELTELDLPSVKTIGNETFMESKLKRLSIPLIETIGKSAFQAADLKTLELTNVTSIGASAFYSSYLIGLSLPKVETIGDHGFHHAIITTLELPEVTNIGANAFIEAPLTNINLPKATSIGASAFESIVNATSTKVTIKDTLINTDAKKDAIFGTGNWTNITFIKI